MFEDGIIVDNFAGGGGASTGIEMALGRSVDIAINHDPDAILMHKTNHPDTEHYCENVWDVDPVQVCRGRKVALAWFSPDCKHFSKAKGGKPKDKNIRGLAWVALRWAGLVRPRVIMLENVEEFKDWGPLNRSHRPIKKKKGYTFRKFIQQFKELGYEVKFGELVAADYGTPTMRKRFFMVARCDGEPIHFPKPTHGARDSIEVYSGELQPYVGAYTQIDFSLPCPSIFATSEEIKERYGIKAVRPLAEKTMERIARGLKKFVIDNNEPFIIPVGDGEYASFHLIQYHSETSKKSVRGQSVKEPIMTVDSSNRYGLVSALVQKNVGGNYKDCGSNVENKLHTITTLERNSLCAVNLIQMNNHCDGRDWDVRKPIPIIAAGNGHFGTVKAFLVKYYGGGTGQDIQNPLDTITTRDRFGLVMVNETPHQIVDIGMRMLEPKELYGCQGFPHDYIIDHDYTGKGYSRSKQVARCGNAVPPPMVAALVRANG